MSDFEEFFAGPPVDVQARHAEVDLPTSHLESYDVSDGSEPLINSRSTVVPETRNLNRQPAETEDDEVQELGRFPPWLNIEALHDDRSTAAFDNASHPSTAPVDPIVGEKSDHGPHAAVAQSNCLPTGTDGEVRHDERTERSQDPANDPPTLADKWQESLGQLGRAADKLAHDTGVSHRFAIESMLQASGWTNHTVEDVETALQLARSNSQRVSPEIIEISSDSDSANEANPPGPSQAQPKRRRGKPEPWTIEQHIVTVRCILNAGRQSGAHWKSIAAKVNEVGGHRRSISVMQKTFWEVSNWLSNQLRN